MKSVIHSAIHADDPVISSEMEHDILMSLCEEIVDKIDNLMIQIDFRIQKLSVTNTEMGSLIACLSLFDQGEPYYIVFDIHMQERKIPKVRLHFCNIFICDGEITVDGEETQRFPLDDPKSVSMTVDSIEKMAMIIYSGK